MTTLIYGKQTKDDRDRVYARLETSTDKRSGMLRSMTFGTLSQAYLEMEVVKAAISDQDEVSLDELDGHYENELHDDFEKRSLSAFVSEFADRTPYPLEQAEVIVTQGWFEMDTRETVQAINQYLREPYDDITEETVMDRLATARETHQQIQNTDEYPFGI